MSSTSSPFAFTRLSRVIALTIVAGYILLLVYPAASQFLSLIPGRTLPLVWNLFTAALVDNNLGAVVFNVLAVLLVSRIVEPYYGSKEYLKLIVLVNLATNFAIFVTVFLMFVATQKGVILYTTFSGFQGVTAGMLVAVKQVMPHHEVSLMGALTFKVKHVPSFFLLLAIPTFILTGHQYDVMFLLYGTYFSWVYLRFFQQQSNLPVKGDPSEDFKFSSFFPPVLAPPIDQLAKILGAIFRLRHSSTLDGMEFASLPTHVSVGEDGTDSTRRRERGQKALEERLKKGVSDVESNL